MNNQWREANTDNSTFHHEDESVNKSVDKNIDKSTDKGEPSVEDCQLLNEGLHTAETLVPLKALKPRFLRYLFASAKVQALFQGQTLFEANSYDKKHIYLLHGQVELQYNGRHSEIISGGNADFPLAHKTPRSCKAIARSDCSILSIDSEQLDRILSWDQISQYLMTEIAVQRDYDEDNAWMQTVLDSNLFLKVPPVNVEQIFSRLTPMVVLEGEAIIRQGEIGDCCYFIKEGTAAVTQRTLPPQVGLEPGLKHLANIGVGRCFGEDALVYETVRNANVTMTSDGVLMRLEKSDFMLLLKEPQVRQVPWESLAAQSGAILVDVRTEEEYSAGHLESAANVPLNLLCLKKRLLAKDKPYLFYCDTGRRSKAAAFLLGREGYDTAALRDGLRGAGTLGDLSQGQDYIIRAGELVNGQ